MLAWPVQTKLYRVNICLQLRYIDSPFHAYSVASCSILVGTVGVLANVSDMSGSDSDDALRDLVPDILGIHDDDDELFMAIDSFYWEDEDADLWNSDDELDHAELHMLQNLRRPRTAQTYTYSGDMLQCVHGTNVIADKNWYVLPEWEQKARWLDAVRCERDVFEELVQGVTPHMPASDAINPHYRTYAIFDKLFVTVYFLAHCPTMRGLQNLFNVPHNTASKSILRPTIAALKKFLITDGDTKVVKFPETIDELVQLMGTFKKHKLPGLAGVIDGTLIPMKKPSKEQAGGDTDAYWCYKGRVMSLCLAVVDGNGLFVYLNAGNPGCLGDASLWSRSSLCKLVEDGLLNNITCELDADGEQHSIHGYLIGDAAFPLNENMLKIFPEPPANEANNFGAAGKREFNRRLIAARRGVECSFGRLKGRFAFCARNTFWKCPVFCRDAIMTCGGLHNFLESRNVAYDVNLERYVEDLNMHRIAGGDQLVRVPGANTQQAGRDVRDFLCRWIVNGN
jgi:hypothetical protein